jgi:DNA/RNA-binding domain of Phe-tRNA-synthetase-like protein
MIINTKQEKLSMRFTVEEKAFALLPTACFGVVVARGVDNSINNPAVMAHLEKTIENTRDKFSTIRPKEHPDLQPYREAFIKMQINPNKFPCSVEALSTRIAKGSGLPDINPAVNLVNAYSLEYTLPMGAHDLDSTDGDIEVRFSRAGDLFTPFGESEPEILEDGELVYAAGNTIKTRKWIWRQSDFGKVTAKSSNIFFPIDGFADYNYKAVIEARDRLAADLELLLNGKTEKYYVDINNRSIEIG